MFTKLTELVKEDFLKKYRGSNLKNPFYEMINTESMDIRGIYVIFKIKNRYLGIIYDND